jgi:hypothetical protein
VADAPLDTCGCCEGIAPATPAATVNPPGQTRLVYRVGTHARFRESMLAAIRRQPALAGLATRADGDPSVAVTDAFATALDVLTFYNERFVNEGYLRTATERRSVLELARAIGYELAPGVAASTYLAFTLEEAPGAPQRITIAAGAKAQSIPGQDELPQVFETGAAIEARPAWNAMRPQLFARTLPKPNVTSLWFAGTATNLRQGDAILFVHAEGAQTLPTNDAASRWQLRRLLEVTQDDDGRRTFVRWGKPLNSHSSPETTVHALRTRAYLFGHNAPPTSSLLMTQNLAQKAAAPTVLQVMSEVGTTIGSEAVAPFMETVKSALTQAAEDLRIKATALNAALDPALRNLALDTGETLSETLDLVTELGNGFDNTFLGFVDLVVGDKVEQLKTASDSMQTMLGHLQKVLGGLIAAGVEAAPAIATFASDLAQIFLRLKLAEGKSYVDLAANTAQAIPTAMQQVSDAAASLAQPAAAVLPTPDDSFAANILRINLDMVYGQVVASEGTDHRFAGLITPTETSVFKITAVAEESVAEYTMSGKTTQLTLNANVPAVHNRRNTTVYCQSEQLTVAEAPLDDPMPRNVIALDRVVDGFGKGQRLAFTGRTIDADGKVAPESVGEIAELESANVVDGRTRLTLVADLVHDFQRAAVRINGNVAPATHGETRKEVLGSGDASVPLQTFTLKQTPLTFVRATNAAGAASTLRIRVNDVLWSQSPSLYTAQPDDDSYIVRLGDDGKAVLTFGDGARGRRLPTGTENVEATYRIGIGEAGLVKANQISLLVSRPLGVKEVVNPLAPEGAENPETLDTARENAPLKVLTLDRVVSLTDFENFARAFGGIAKARAVWLWDGERRLVHLTLAAPKAQPVAADSDLGRALRTALDGARHPAIPLRLGPMELKVFSLAARVKVDARYETEAVHAAIRDRLIDVFSFERMAFAQGVAASHILAEMQTVTGVVAVDLEALYFDATGPGTAVPSGLPALGARWAGNVVATDQMLVLDPNGITLTELTP